MLSHRTQASTRNSQFNPDTRGKITPHQIPHLPTSPISIRGHSNNALQRLRRPSAPLRLPTSPRRGRRHHRLTQQNPLCLLQRQRRSEQATPGPERLGQAIRDEAQMGIVGAAATRRAGGADVKGGVLFRRSGLLAAVRVLCI